jgi:hypothetical protein
MAVLDIEPNFQAVIDSANRSNLRRELSFGEDNINDGPPNAPGAFYSDPSTELAVNKGYFIEVYHIISSTPVFFKAFLTDFTDNFITNYNKEQVFGRSDPIQTYQNTERVINVAFDLVSSNINEARANMIKANHLISMMYPSYEEAGVATSIKSGPLFKVKMGNLICKPKLTEEDGVTPAVDAGLSCTIGGFKYNPVIEDGFFDPKPGIFYPQTIKIDLELSILHEQPLGFTDKTSNTAYDSLAANQTVAKPGFPYGGDPALSLNGGTGDPRQDLPSSITRQGQTRGTLINGENRQEIATSRGVVSVYVRQEGLVREGERPGVRSWVRNQRRLASERLRVQTNKILSAKNRDRIGSVLSDPEGAFDDFIVDGYFP